MKPGTISIDNDAAHQRRLDYLAAHAPPMPDWFSTPASRVAESGEVEGDQQVFMRAEHMGAWAMAYAMAVVSAGDQAWRAIGKRPPTDTTRVHDQDCFGPVTVDEKGFRFDPVTSTPTVDLNPRPTPASRALDLLVNERRLAEVDGMWVQKFLANQNRVDGDLSLAAACYAFDASQALVAHPLDGGRHLAESYWPGRLMAKQITFNPSDDPLSNLVRAGVLITLQIEDLLSGVPAKADTASERGE